MTRFELIHRNSSLKGQRISLIVDESESGCEIGRSRRSNLLLPTPDVSRHHCRLICVSDQIYILDLGSRAGTIVNRQRVSTETPVLLKHRDKLQIGKWKFRFLDTEAEETQDAHETVVSQPATTALASSMDMLLNELNDIASQFGEGDFNSSNTITLDSIESESIRTKAEKSKSLELKEAAIKDASEKLSARPVQEPAKEETACQSDSDFTQNDAVAEPADEEKKAERFKKLPDHLRSKGPADSTTAADEALKRFFGD